MYLGKCIKNDVYEVINRSDVLIKFTNYCNEVDIGFRYINALRDEIPNFGYYISCNNDVTMPGKKYNILMEKLDGILFYRLIPSLTIEEIYEITLQILLSLLYANKKFGFQHSDLSIQNVIVHKLPTRMVIEYPLLNTKISTNYIAYIIDYEFSLTHDIRENDTTVMNDIYLLYLTIMIAMETNYRDTLFYKNLIELIEPWGIGEETLEWYYDNCIKSSYYTDEEMLLKQLNDIKEYTTSCFETKDRPTYIWK